MTNTVLSRQKWYLWHLPPLIENKWITTTALLSAPAALVGSGRPAMASSASAATSGWKRKMMQMHNPALFYASRIPRCCWKRKMTQTHNLALFLCQNDTNAQFLCQNDTNAQFLCQNNTNAQFLCQNDTNTQFLRQNDTNAQSGTVLMPAEFLDAVSSSRLLSTHSLYPPPPTLPWWG